MWFFFEAGGIMMYPLLAGSVLVVAYSTERFIHFFRARRHSTSPEEIHGLIEKGRLQEALELARAMPGPVAAVLEAGLSRAGESRKQIEEEIMLKGTAELERLRKHLPLIELISRSAPLIGLLGTVLGMVTAFQQVAGAQGAVDPSMLAGGIWEALITTAAGLGVAIPAMIIHHFLEEQVQYFSGRMKFYGSEAVKHLGASV
ncbi:MAG TPA: MotA/TolQ/ExbB proton channel family protein [Prosthecochloris aestuarii]|uniref:MotA/TolQ/ExbB proton channel family protein n=1 Tax=Prosthecochloris aestuarii TaxID=1102 RepID=A0A831SNK9_PROAE|nr:MotA/TolQ/ExbB proton channel family protein [Prosthecochloris aestuarii]